MSPDITTRPIALVGLMGVGKTTVGRRLARKLGRKFYDSDDEIESASGRTVAGYFRDHGEAEFRSGERRVIERLLDGKPIILDFNTVMERVSRNREKRPLLRVADPRAKMRELMDARHPIYAKAHITVPIARGPHIRTVHKVIRAIKAHESENA